MNKNQAVWQKQQHKTVEKKNLGSFRRYGQHQLLLQTPRDTVRLHKQQKNPPLSSFKMIAAKFSDIT